MDYNDEEKARLLDALFADGVDNWEGFQQANYQEVINEIEIEQEINSTLDVLEPLFEMICLDVEVEYPIGREGGHNVVVCDDLRKKISKFILQNFYKK